MRVWPVIATWITAYSVRVSISCNTSSMKPENMQAKMAMQPPCDMPRFAARFFCPRMMSRRVMMAPAKETEPSEGPVAWRKERMTFPLRFVPGAEKYHCATAPPIVNWRMAKIRAVSQTR